jgi:hypothetical protein
MSNASSEGALAGASPAKRDSKPTIHLPFVRRLAGEASRESRGSASATIQSHGSWRKNEQTVLGADDDVHGGVRIEVTHLELPADADFVVDQMRLEMRTLCVSHQLENE